MAGSSAYGSSEEGDTIKLREERLRAEKQPIETGEVTVRKDIRTETQSLEVPIQREEVVIERTSVQGGMADEGISAGDIGEGEQIRIPVREEQVNVTKEPVVTEEVRVGKRTIQDTQHVSGQVRKEDVKIDRTGNVNVRTHDTGQGTESP